MLRKLKIGLYAILLTIILTLSSVIVVFAAFSSNIESGIYITYEIIQEPVILTKNNFSEILKVRKDTAISWSETEQSAKVVAYDTDGKDGSSGLKIHDVAIYIDFGDNTINTSEYKIIVICCKWINKGKYSGKSTVYPLVDKYNSNEKTSFEKVFSIPNTDDYVYQIIDFTNFTSTWNDVTYEYEGGILTGLRFDYFDKSDDNLEGQGLYIKSITMCQTLAAAERLFG